MAGTVVTIPVDAWLGLTSRGQLLSKTFSVAASTNSFENVLTNNIGAPYHLLQYVWVQNAQAGAAELIAYIDEHQVDVYAVDGQVYPLWLMGRGPIRLTLKNTGTQTCYVSALYWAIEQDVANELLQLRRLRVQNRVAAFAGQGDR